MADPQTPVPPDPSDPSTPAVPFWRRVAQFAGIEDELDAASAAAHMAGGWLQSKLPQPSADTDAAYARLKAAGDARQADQAARRQALGEAVAAPVKHFFGSAPVQQVGRQFAEDAHALTTPSADLTTLARLAHDKITQRSDAVRAALPSGPATAPLDWMVAAQNDWIPNALIDQGVDASTPAGALGNADLPIGPALHAAAGAAGAVGGAAHLAASLPPGFYSRVDRIAEAVGKNGIHPNKLASLLKAGASGEEVAYRQLPEFLASKGNQMISKDELAAHLAAHPPPEIGQTVLGGPNPKHLTALPEGYSLQLARGHRSDGDLSFTLVNPTGEGRILYADNREDALQEALVHLQGSRGGPKTLPTKYSSYTLPGGENYREHLTQLATQPHNPYDAFTSQMESKYGVGYDTAALTPEEQTQQAMLWDRSQRSAGGMTESQFRSSHFDQPNVLVHTRANERTLPTGNLDDIGERIRQAVGAREVAYLGSGAPEIAVRKGLVTPDEAQAFGHWMGFTNYPEPANRGRFLEEVQSDWHQQGKTSGYADPIETARDLHNAGATLYQAENAHAERLREITGGQLSAAELLFLSQVSEPGDTTDQLLARLPMRASWGPPSAQGPEFQARARAWLDEQTAAGHRSPVSAAWSGMNALSQTQRAVDEAHSAFQAVRQQQQKLVPDAPFKEAWPDLALKQQLLDVAHRQDLSWLGFTSGKTQAERYDLSKRISRVGFQPEDAGDYSLGTLVAHDHAGNEVIRQHRLTPAELDEYIGKEPGDALRRQIAGAEHDAAQWSITRDPEDGLFYVVDPNGEYHANGSGTELGAQRVLREILEGDYYSDAGRGHPEISGLDLQVGGEGMAHFYDQLLPKRLEKLVKPFGGTVERGSVPITKETGLRDAPGFVVRDNYGNHRGWWPAEAEAHAYIDAPPPQMRSIVSREGGASVHPATGTQMVNETVDEPAWIARLSPEAKAQMRAKGFPLMSFLPPALLGGAAASELAGPGRDPDGRSRGDGDGAPAPVSFTTPRDDAPLARVLKRTGLFGDPNQGR